MKLPQWSEIVLFGTLALVFIMAAFVTTMISRAVVREEDGGVPGANKFQRRSGKVGLVLAVLALTCFLVMLAFLSQDISEIWP